MISLLGVMIDAPVIGVRKRWPDTLHALPMDSIAEGFKRGTFRSACGLQGLRMYGDRQDGIEYVLPWPPRVKGLPFVRCKECFDATGRMRPRATFRPMDGETA